MDAAGAAVGFLNHETREKHERNMIPAGYMAKRVACRPEWMKAERVVDVYSVSNCVSRDFTDYIGFWRHNGFWFFDSPKIIQEVAEEHSIDMKETKLFYYEVYEKEYDEDEEVWNPFSPEASLTTRVIEPDAKVLEGYDVVTFYSHASPECSPLSCNGLASEIETNEHCLLPSLERAKELLEGGLFRDSEPGPLKVFAVYSRVSW